MYICVGSDYVTAAVPFPRVCLAVSCLVVVVDIVVVRSCVFVFHRVLCMYSIFSMI